MITATEPNEANEQTHHTTITIRCATATTTAAFLPAGGGSPVGWILGALGVGLALVAGIAVRTRRWFAPRRHAASQSS